MWPRHWPARPSTTSATSPGRSRRRGPRSGRDRARCARGAPRAAYAAVNLSLAVQQSPGFTAVAHAIQLAVGPVFLLSGIGAMLAGLTSRLSRIIDRARTLEGQLVASPPNATGPLQAQLAALARRAQLISRAITLCTITALLVCAVIATLFLGAFARFDTSVPVAMVFVAAMVTFFAGLLFFLRERSEEHT